MRRTYLLFLFALISQFAWSQKYMPVERFSFDDGLATDEVTCLYQDHSGFLWIGTKKGLQRFDGYSFKTFPANLADRGALPAAHILRLFQDPENYLWVLTDLGISKLNKAGDHFESYFVFTDSLKNKPPARLKDAALNWKDNQILILNEHGLSVLDIANAELSRLSVADNSPLFKPERFSELRYNGLTNYFYIYSDSEVLQYETGTDSVSRIAIENGSLITGDGGIKGFECGVNGECWLYTSRHLWHLREDRRLRRVNLKGLAADETIFEIKQVAEECLHIVTNSSVLKLNLETGKIHQMFHYGFPAHLDLTVNSFLREDKGIFWIGTSAGLFQFHEFGKVFISRDIASFMPSGSSIAAMDFDTENNLWIAGSEGDIFILRDPGKQEEMAVLARGKTSGEINGLKHIASKDSMLLGTNSGLEILSRKKNTIYRTNLFSEKVDVFDILGNDTVLLISNDSLFSLSIHGNFRTDSRKIGADKGSDALGIIRRGKEIFILEPHQLLKQSINDTVALTMSLAGTGLNAIPVNSCFLLSNKREIIVGTSMGLYIFYPDDFAVLPSFIDLGVMNTPVLTLYQDTSQLLWFTSKTGLYTLNRLENQLKYYCARDGLIPPEQGLSLVAANSEGQLAYAGVDELIVFHPDSLPEEKTSPRVQLMHVEIITRKGIENLALLDTDTLRLKSKFTMLRFYSSVIDYWNPELNTYQYSFRGIDREDEWSDISGENIIQIPSLKAGDYKLKIRGANSKNIWSDEPDEVVLHIAAPIWRSRIAFFVYIILVILIFYFSLFFTTRHLRRLNREYKEREQIAKKVEQQKEELTLKNKNITDSINYAKRIQMALMPSQRLFSNTFRDSFILHIPKDIVSGDFYWINEIDGRIYFAAVDCTGHGVPGAFMSIIGFELFRRITEIEKKKRPAEILNSLSQGFETIFRDIEDITLRDGMDVAFCAIDPEMKVLEYAGAFNPLYLIRNNTISEIKGDRFSVGLNQSEDGVTPQEFQDHVIKLKDQDIIYIFTDGYADQFGGPEGKKYKYRRFRHLLLALHQLPMERQLEFLRRSIMDWKGDLDQVDDILVMGIRISHNTKA